MEIAWLVALVPLAGWAWVSRKSSGRPSRLDIAFSNFGRRRRLAALSVGILALLVRAALLPLHPVPQPGVVDEFSYLLAGDTFASGRIANPTHPHWVSFENSMILSQPTYVSKYPPGQGLVLAAGILLARNAWVGVWLSVGVLCTALVWMLQAWVTPRWALLGGLLAMMRIAVGSYWIDSYWGGAVAATGGALLYGSWPRLKRRGRLRDGLMFGIALAVLANSRPFEGCLAAAPAVVSVTIWALRRGRSAIRPLLPVVVILLVAAAAILGYNAKTTGNPLVMPYQLHEARYSGTPLFWFQSLRPDPMYRHEPMRTFWTDFARGVYLENFKSGLMRASLRKLDNLRSFFLGSLLTLSLLALPSVLRSKRSRPAYLCLGVVLAGLLLEIDVVPHYAAPVTALIYLVVIECLRVIRATGRIGRAVAGALPLLLAATLIVFYASEAAGVRFLHEVYSWCFTRPGNVARARILEELNGAEGRHLVLVRYDANFKSTHTEWVYNRADIDAAKVVWAWESEPQRDHELIRYFSSRKVWLVEADSPQPRLTPYLVIPR